MLVFLCWDCRALLAQLDVIEELLPRVLGLCSLPGAAAVSVPGTEPPVQVRARARLQPPLEC